MNIQIFANKEEASQQAFILIKEALDQNKLNFGMMTGESPKLFYQMLRESDLDFTQANSINLDEFYGLGEEDEHSYHYYMEKHLFKFKQFNQTFIPNGKNYNLIDEIDRYEQILADYPRDIQMLGIGVNGHIGFNEPGESFNSTTHLTRLAETTIGTYQNYFKGLERPPEYAYSMGIKSIMDADQIILLAFGAHKAKAVRDMIEGPVTRKVPASILQNHPNTVILLDREASRLLNS